jgi:hypothetical protein
MSKPKVEKHECSAKVTDSGGWYKYPCSVNGKYFEDGLWWCHHHAPSKEAERKEKVSAKYAAQREAYDSKLDQGHDRAQRLSELLHVNFGVAYRPFVAQTSPTGGVVLSGEDSDILINILIKRLEAGDVTD